MASLTDPSCQDTERKAAPTCITIKNDCHECLSFSGLRTKILTVPPPPHLISIHLRVTV